MSKTVREVVIHFECWGLACTAEAPSLEHALKWCCTCFGYGFNYPEKIVGIRGNTIYEKEQLWDYMAGRI